MMTGPVPAGIQTALFVATGRVSMHMSVLTVLAAIAFPPFGLPALARLRDSRRAASAGDAAGRASALRRARCWALAALAAVAFAMPAGGYAWYIRAEATATCTCTSPTFERDR
jgi:hypothetical protein